MAAPRDRRLAVSMVEDRTTVPFATKDLPSLLGRIEGWIFRPSSARRLAAVRIGLCLLLAGRLSRPLYRQLASQPRVLFRPLSFMHLFPAMPGVRFVVTVQILALIACLLAAAGLSVRVTLPIAFVGALILNGMWTSVGQPMHNDTLPLLPLVPLLFAPTADAWSISARSRRLTPPAESARYGWPLHTAMIVVAGAYFFSGFHKLIGSGPTWVFSDNLRWVMYGISDLSQRPIEPAIFLASHPLLAHAAAAVALVTEFGFPLILWKPRLGWLFVPSAVLLHVAIGLTLHLDYSAWALTTIIVFVPWGASGRSASRVDSIRH